MTRIKSIKSTIAFVICSIAIVNNNIQTTNACTNYLITPGATTDGSAFISYAADSGSLYGTLGFYPAGDHPSTARRECYDWDSGNYLGSIPEAAHTYNVVGNVNEHQLTITETTFGGLGQFSSQKGAILISTC